MDTPCCPSCGQTLPQTRLVVDLNTNHVVCGDRKVHLPPRQAEILKVLYDHMPRVVSDEYLEACVVGLEEDSMSYNWASHHICKLRKKLVGLPLEIINHHGLGHQPKLTESAP